MFTDSKRKNDKVNYNNFKSNFGFLKVKNNKSFYLNITSWVVLDNDNETVRRNLINKQIKRLLYNTVDPNIINPEKIIVDLSYRKAGLKVNTKCYFELELIFFSKNETFTQNNELRDEILKINSTLIDDLLNKLNGLTFHITK